MSQEGAPVRAYLWGWSHDVCKSVFVGCDADVETVRGDCPSKDRLDRGGKRRRMHFQDARTNLTFSALVQG